MYNLYIFGLWNGQGSIEPVVLSGPVFASCWTPFCYPPYQKHQNISRTFYFMQEPGKGKDLM